MCSRRFPKQRAGHLSLPACQEMLCLHFITLTARGRTNSNMQLPFLKVKWEETQCLLFFVWFMYTGIATSRLPCSFWPLLCNISLKYANKVSGSSGTSHSQVQWWYEKPLRCGAFFNSSLLQVDSTFYFDICAPFVVL